MSLFFTKVPIGEAVEVIRSKLREDEDLAERTPLSPDGIAELLDLCLRSTYFSYMGVNFMNGERVLLWAPISVVVANLYIEFFEELALESTSSIPCLWKQYVDDTCYILKTYNVDRLLDNLNQL